MFNPTNLTGFHTWLSLLALLAGIAVTIDLLGSRERRTLTGSFLMLAFLTSATGFLFPRTEAVTPAEIIGVLALAVLLVATVTGFGNRFARGWSRTYAVTLVISTYLLAFVAVAQAFQKVPILAAGAPAGFVLSQAALLLGFVAAAFLATRRIPAATVKVSLRTT